MSSYILSQQLYNSEMQNARMSTSMLSQDTFSIMACLFYYY